MIKRSVTMEGKVTWLTKRGVRTGFWKIGIRKGKGRKSHNTWEQALNKVSKVFTGDCLVKDLKVYYPIKGQGRENQIFSSSKEEFILACAFTTY